MAITKNFIRNMKWNIDVYKKSGIDVGIYFFNNFNNLE